MAAIAGTAVDMINLPKPESAETIRAAAAALVRCEAARGIERPIGILANIESPRGVRLAAEIASAHPRVVGLQLGLGDLFEPSGIDRGDALAVHGMQLAVRLAAAEAGVWACDTVYAAVTDPDGYTREAEDPRAGYIGKSCVRRPGSARERGVPAERRRDRSGTPRGRGGARRRGRWRRRVCRGWPDDRYPVHQARRGDPRRRAPPRPAPPLPDALPPPAPHSLPQSRPTSGSGRAAAACPAHERERSLRYGRGGAGKLARAMRRIPWPCRLWGHSTT